MNKIGCHPGESRDLVQRLGPDFRRGEVDKIILFFRCLAVALGVLFAWTARQMTNPDAMCYLDLADAFRTGQWKNAVNLIWCPLYPALLGFASYLVKPSAYWEFPLVHLVNFTVYLVTLAGFEFLMSGLRQRRHPAALPEAGWIALCYMAFLYGTLSLIQLMTVTPDLCVAAAVFWASAFVTRIQNGDVRMRTFALLGVVLGLGYFSKTVMAVMGFVFLAAGAMAARPWRRGIPSALGGVMVFLLTLSLFLVPLHRIKHRFTFGDIGRIRYAWQILHLGNFPFHPEGAPGYGVPKHPVRILVENPTIYEFGSHLAGTYSLAFDMSYWFEGLEFQTEFRKQIPILWKSLKVYADIAQVELSLFLGLFILFRMRGRNSGWLQDILSEYILILPALAALAIFGLMEAEGRYVGAYVTLLLIGIVSAARISPEIHSTRRIRGLVLLMLLGPLINLLHGAGSFVKHEWWFHQGLETPLCVRHWQVAEDLTRAGIKEGDHVASLQAPYGAFWARLSKTRIVAQSAEDPNQFWNAVPAAQAQALNAMKAVGVRAVVGERNAAQSLPPGWQRVKRGDYCIYLISGNSR